MKKRTVELAIDLANLPQMTEAERADLVALHDMGDGEIDHSDIPQLTDTFSDHAMSNPFLHPTKTRTTIMLDSDVLAWFEAQGAEYQTRINAVLRRAMIEATRRG